jgi:septum formation protein
MYEPRVILASASPRRSQLLLQIGVAHQIVPANIEERRAEGEAIEACVRRLAEQKARQVRAIDANAQGLPVLGADTAVAIDGQMLGKPRDAQHGMAMLEQLAGRTHEVLSAVALADGQGVRSHLSVSQVRLRRIGRMEAERYWDSGEPHDKAGGYAIQGLGAVFIEWLQGSYSGVMGLPLFETALLLGQGGVPLGRHAG